LLEHRHPSLQIALAEAQLPEHRVQQSGSYLRSPVLECGAPVAEMKRAMAALATLLIEANCNAALTA
jgi:hypothetical protein